VVSHASASRSFARIASAWHVALWGFNLHRGEADGASKSRRRQSIPITVAIASAASADAPGSGQITA
jgi:hypothetical protein